MAGGLVSPGRVGEVSRVAFLGRGNRAAVVGLVLLDRLADLTVVLVLALAGLARLVPATALVVAALLAVAAGIAVRPEVAVGAAARLAARTGPFARMASSLTQGAHRLATWPMAFKVRFLGYTVFGYLVALVQFHLLLANYGPVDFAWVLLTQPVIMLINTVPVTVAGLGMREGAAVLLLAPFGVSAAAALSAAFLLFLLNTAVPGVAGMALLGLDQSPERPVSR